MPENCDGCGVADGDQLDILHCLAERVRTVRGVVSPGPGMSGFNSHGVDAGGVNVTDLQQPLKTPSVGALLCVRCWGGRRSGLDSAGGAVAHDNQSFHSF